MANKYDTQIIRFDGKNCFVEAVTTALSIGKLLLNFCTYDEKSHKETNRLDIYLDIDEALYFSELLRSGRLERTINQAKQAGTFGGKPINDFTSYYTVMGGTKNNSQAFAKYQKKFPWLVEAKCSCLSKQLKVQASTKYKYMLRAEFGPGKESSTGLIVPDGPAKSYVQIPLSEDMAMKFALKVSLCINAYMNQYYSRFADKLFGEQKCNVFEANSEYNSDRTVDTGSYQTAQPEISDCNLQMLDGNKAIIKGILSGEVHTWQNGYNSIDITDTNGSVFGSVWAKPAEYELRPGTTVSMECEVNNKNYRYLKTA